MWLIAWKDVIALGLILHKLSNFKCSYYCQSTMYELDEERRVSCLWKLSFWICNFIWSKWKVNSHKKCHLFCSICWVRNTNCHDLVTLVSIIRDIYKSYIWEWNVLLLQWCLVGCSAASVFIPCDTGKVIKKVVKVNCSTDFNETHIKCVQCT